MHGLTEESRTVIADLARRYSISEEAVLAMLAAMERGNRTMAQFNIPELGGNGQWMLGGMTMVGDMFNYGLKSTVDGLCGALSQALSSGRLVMPRVATSSHSWWPAELGAPSSVGGQNDSAYAVFPTHRRLAIKTRDGITLYDTGDHLISGVGQQQGSNDSMTFSSQLGSYSVSGLRRADSGSEPSAPSTGPAPTSQFSQSSSNGGGQSQGQWQGGGGQSQGFAPIQALGQGQAFGQGQGFGQSQGQGQWPSPPAPFDVVPQAAPAETATAEVARAVEEVAPPTERATPAASSAQPPAVDALQLVALIEKLGSLRDAGLLTEAEFSAKKAELLARL